MKQLALTLLFASSLFAQDLTHKAAKQQGPIAIVGATVHPVSGPAIESGVVLFANGRLTYVGKGENIKSLSYIEHIVEAVGLNHCGDVFH